MYVATYEASCQIIWDALLHNVYYHLVFFFSYHEITLEFQHNFKGARKWTAGSPTQSLHHLRDDAGTGMSRTDLYPRSLFQLHNLCLTPNVNARTRSWAVLKRTWNFSMSCWSQIEISEVLRMTGIPWIGSSGRPLYTGVDTSSGFMWKPGHFRDLNSTMLVKYATTGSQRTPFNEIQGIK